MNLALPRTVAALVGLAAVWAGSRQPVTYTILLTGDSMGSLGPCGCSQPMVGGLARLGSAIRTFRSPESILVANGAFSGGLGQQEQMKAQTLTQALTALHVDAIRLGDQERETSEIRLAVQNIADDVILSEAKPTISSGPFLIVGSSNPGELRRLTNEVRTQGQQVLLMLDGDRTQASDLAREVPGLAIIQYREDGRGESFRIGATLLITPGSKLRDLAVVTVQGGTLIPQILPLDTRIADDPATARIVRGYLDRVARMDLLGKFPRTESVAYAGSQSCTSCHGKASAKWRNSGHRDALKSLVKVGHDRDPECVSCHVVGLNSTSGFRTAAQTPHLAGVGCESCHGAGVLHARNPKKVGLPKIGETVCRSCHTPDQSPGFQFEKAWKKIAH